MRWLARGILNIYFWQVNIGGGVLTVTESSKYEMIGTWEFEHLFLAGQYWRGVLPVTESGIGTFISRLFVRLE